MSRPDRLSQLHIVAAFSDSADGGALAAVCLLDVWPDDRELRTVAMQSGPSVTAFVGRPSAQGVYTLRWFTRGGREVFSFCGHATFAAAHVIGADRQPDEIFVFEAFCGRVRLRKLADGYEMTGPAWPAKDHPLPAGLAGSLGAIPDQCLKGERDWLLIYDDPAALRLLAPDFVRMRLLGDVGFIATSSLGPDRFAFRFFCPGFSIGEDEDPATGSALSCLAPYWADRLGQTHFFAEQWSSRGARFECAVTAGGVAMSSTSSTLSLGHVALEARRY